MRQNRFKELVAAGRVPVGHMIMEFATRGIARLLEAAGVDFCLVDMEHSGFGVDVVADLIALFRGTAVTPFVRVPQPDYHFIARALDVGALGIMVPNVESGAVARDIVAAAKYSPIGKRGLALGAAHTDFELPDAAAYTTWANENTTILCQIESAQGVEHVEEIAATPGVDVLWVGHNDLSLSLGIPGQLEHRRFLSALERVVTAARQQGLAAGVQAGNVAQAREWLAMGFNVISFGADARVYMTALEQGVRAMRELAAER